MFLECSSPERAPELEPVPYGPVCPAGYDLRFPNYCYTKAASPTRPTPPIQNKTQQSIGPPCSANCAGDPINTGTGNKYEKAVDYRGHGAFPLVFSRFYNSLGRTDSGSQKVGAKWFSNVGAPRLFIADCATDKVRASGSGDRDGCDGQKREAFLRRPSGKVISFTQTYAKEDSRDPWHSEDGHAGRFVTTQSGYAYTAPNGLTEHFSVIKHKDNSDIGRLISVTSRAGIEHDYDSDDRLSAVTTSFGRQLTFGYDDNGRLATLTDPAGGVYHYDYDGDGNLVKVTTPAGHSVEYRYENSAYPHALTGLIDADGNRYATWHYDDHGRAVVSENAGGTNRISVAYQTNAQDQVVAADITEASGRVRHSTFHWTDGVNQFVSTSAPCGQCGSLRKHVSYDGQFIKRTTAFNGAETTYSRNAIGLQQSRTEAAGTPQARTVTTQWNKTLRLPTRITWPDRSVTLAYNNRGQVTQKTVTDTTTDKSHVWAYTYNDNGLLASVNGPRRDVNDVTRFAYDAVGNLATVTNALGQTTSLTRYNARGEPLTIVGPNGTETAFTYDARGRLTSRAVAGYTAHFKYDPAGQLIRVTLPTGATLNYSYDAAHRLTAITDAAGNTIRYTLDKRGNPVKQTTVNSAGGVARTVQRVFGKLNHLVKRIGGNGQTTQYVRNDAGQATRTIDPLHHVTRRTFDPLHRLAQAVDPADGSTAYTYNSQNQRTRVNDPRGLKTHYIYNGFGNLIKKVSPDTGTTTYTYDAAGNCISKTDARGVTVHYRYDALNRLKRATYPGDQADDIQYVYDEGPHGVGRLTRVYSAGSITFYHYDARGSVVKKTAYVGSIPFTVRYRYDAASKLVGVTYPDGMQVDYHRNAAGRVTTVTERRNGETYIVASNIKYQPFGPATSLTYGNGLTATRHYDASYRLTHLLVPGIINNAYRYNADSNITSIDAGSDTGHNQTFRYDSLHRVTSANGSYGSRTYGYDADSNRIRETVAGKTTRYGYGTENNHLLNVNGQQYQYDAIGNLISDGTHTYTYNTAGRLTGYDSHTNAYAYNALGERVRKRTPTTRTNVYFVHGPGGRLLGKYDAWGHLIKAHIWLNGHPIAVATPEAIDYVTTDQLGTPRVITNADQTIMWRWKNTPFGLGQPNDNPSGLGSFTYNLRLPGQYYDADTGLHYNWHRYYDPRIGRYTRSDPVGLAGGVNAYLYALDNPLLRFDRYGLLTAQQKNAVKVAAKELEAMVSHGKFPSGITGAAYDWSKVSFSVLKANLKSGYPSWRAYKRRGISPFGIDSLINFPINWQHFDWHAVANRKESFEDTLGDLYKKAVNSANDDVGGCK